MTTDRAPKMLALALSLLAAQACSESGGHDHNSHNHDSGRSDGALRLDAAAADRSAAAPDLRAKPDVRRATCAKPKTVVLVVTGMV